MSKYYDGTKLLSLQDLEGNRPEIYMCTTNRSGGKTTYFSKMLVNSYLKKNEKFGILYRFNYELDSVSDKFFKDIQGLFFKEYEMKSEKRAMGIYHELFIKKIDFPEEYWESCGYAISLNSADAIKKYSHLLSDIKKIMFDEFQSETNKYCDNEVKKFISIHQSIARGKGEQSRYLPVYMIANPISLLNPYYVEMGISNRLNTQTVYLRGTGFVLEQGFVESASEAQKESSFNRAFSNNNYIAYASEGNYLNDSTSFIEKVTGHSRYLATLKYQDKEYAIREYAEQGIIYCDDRPDKTYPYKLAITTDDHQVNYVMLKRNDLFLSNMRYYFERGVFRFKNLQCKEAMLKALSY